MAIAQARSWGVLRGARTAVLELEYAMSPNLLRRLCAAADKGTRVYGARVVEVGRTGFRLIWDAIE